MPRITSVEPLHINRFLYVKVTTDDGLVGFGESGAWGSRKPRPRSSGPSANTSSGRIPGGSPITGSSCTALSTSAGRPSWAH